MSHKVISCIVVSALTLVGAPALGERSPARDETALLDGERVADDALTDCLANMDATGGSARECFPREERDLKRTEADLRSPERVKAQRDYTSCLSRESLALEPSSANFEDVFRAAETACLTHWARFYEELKVLFDNDSDDRAFDAINRFTQSDKNFVRLAFLRLRAQNNAH